MALGIALLVALVVSTTLAGAGLVADLERRNAVAYRVAAELRFAAAGGPALAAAELERRPWGPLLAGEASDTWMRPGSPGADTAALGAVLRRETMMGSAHGADTPSWQLFAHVPWSTVAGVPSRADLVIWLADDWEESDGDPREDANGRVLVRAAAVEGPSIAWTEAVVERDAAGRVRVVHVRGW